MKIACFELEPWEGDIVRKAMRGHQIVCHQTPLTPSTVAKAHQAEAIAIFIYSRITPQLLERLPKLRFIATMSTGYDHIDLTACKERSIKVSNVPSYGENTVAEHTFALILALSRRIPESVERTRQGAFSPKGLRGMDLKGRTIGVIGTGRIGIHVIRMAKGFEMRCLAYDIRKNAAAAKELGFRYVSLRKLLEESDFVTLHCPYVKATHHILDKERIGWMKKGAYLVNTARGPLIDTEALLHALNRRHLAGAALDVLEEEGALKEERQLLSRRFNADYKLMVENQILRRHPRVILTPHNAFNSEEALRRIVGTTLENLKGYIKGRLINVVK